MSRLWYLATPYTDYRAGREAAFHDACFQAALILREGIAVFCPIAHSHPIAEIGNLDPTDHGIWLPADEPLMDAAFGLIVCLLPGWRESQGVTHEIDRFLAAGKPVVKMLPGTVPVREIRKEEELHQ